MVKPELAVAEQLPVPLTAKVAGQVRVTVWLSLVIAMLFGADVAGAKVALPA